MMNAREELLVFLNKLVPSWRDELVCARVAHGGYGFDDRDDAGEQFFLKKGFTSEDLHKFFSDLAFTYDDGFGSQELFGTVWGKTWWAERRQYDGREWWELRRYPTIPLELL
jgi:hypothetical protein